MSSTRALVFLLAASLLLSTAELAAQDAGSEPPTDTESPDAPAPETSPEERAAVDAALSAASRHADDDELDQLIERFQQLSIRLGDREWSQEALDPFTLITEASSAAFAASSRRWAGWIEEPESMGQPLEELDLWLPIHLVSHASQEQPMGPGPLRIARLWLRQSEEVARRDVLGLAAATVARLLRPWVGDEQVASWLRSWTADAGAERASLGDGDLLLVAGDLALAVGDSRQASFDFELAEEIFMNIEKLDAAALAAMKLADCERQSRFRFEEATAAYDRARDRYLRLDQPMGAGQAALGKAELLWENRDSVRSFAAFGRAVELLEKAGDSCLLLQAQLGRASLLLLSRRQAAAKEAEAIHRAILARRTAPPPGCDVCQLFADEARVILEDGTPFEGGSRSDNEDTARRLMLQAGNCLGQEKRPVEEADVLLAAVRLFEGSLSRGERQEGRVAIERILAVRRELGDELGEAITHFEASRLERDDDEKLRLLDLAKKIITPLDEPAWAADIELELVREGLLEDEASELQALGRARRLAESAAVSDLLAEACELEADRVLLDQPQSAAELYERAAKSYEAAGDPFEAGSAWLEAVKLHERLGDGARATAARERWGELRRPHRPAREPSSPPVTEPPPGLEAMHAKSQAYQAELEAYSEKKRALGDAISSRREKVREALDAWQLEEARAALDTLRSLFEREREHRGRRPEMPAFEPLPGLWDPEEEGETLEEMNRRWDEREDADNARMLTSLEAELAWWRGDIAALVATVAPAGPGPDNLDFGTRRLTRSFWTKRFRVTLEELAKIELLRRLAAQSADRPELGGAIGMALVAFDSLEDAAETRRLEARRLFESLGSRQGLAFCDFLEVWHAENPSLAAIRSRHETALAAGLPILALLALELEIDHLSFDPASGLARRLDTSLRAALDAEPGRWRRFELGRRLEDALEDPLLHLAGRLVNSGNLDQLVWLARGSHTLAALVASPPPASYDHQAARAYRAIQRSLARLARSGCGKDCDEDELEDAIELYQNLLLWTDELRATSPRGERRELPVVDAAAMDAVALAERMGPILAFVEAKTKPRGYTTVALLWSPGEAEPRIRVLDDQELETEISVGHGRGFEESARTAWRVLLEPFADLIDRHGRLLVVPHGDLDLLPWPALVDGSGRHLVERWDLVTVPSLSTLAALAQRPREEPRPSSRLALARGGAIDLGRWLERFLTAWGAAESLPIDFATFSGRAPDAGELFVAARGPSSAKLEAFDNDDLPFALYLEAIASAEHDGRLRAQEIAATPLAAELAILLVCDAVMPDDYDVSLDLAEAFLAAGVDSVVAPTWKVPASRRTYDFLHSFFEFRHDAQGPWPTARALAEAQRQAIRDRVSPTVWAAWSLVGLPR